MIFDKLNENLQKCNSLPILFVGTGLSRRYLGVDDWFSLLTHLSNVVYPENVHAIDHFKQIAISELKSANIINDDRIPTTILYPKIAGLIDIELGKKYYTDPRFKDTIETYNDALANGASPIKIEVLKYLVQKNSMESLRTEYSEEIDLLREIGKTSIAGAITTNYDSLLEMIFDDEYRVYIGQDDLLFSSLLEISEIYKIHGSLADPKTIVLTDNDYRAFNEKNQYLAAKLLTMFIEHPIIFLGYSIQDENIRGILQSIAKCMDTEKAKMLKERMIFVERLKDGENEELATYSISVSETKQIEMTHIKTNNFAEVYKCIKNIKAKYPVKWLKRLKNDVYDLALRADTTSKVVVVDINDASVDNYEVVVGIGIQKLGRRGYASITAAEIYQDILFNDGDFINRYLIEETFPRILKGCNPLPVYKYLTKDDLENKEFYKALKTKKYENFVCGTIKKMHLKISGISDIKLNSYTLGTSFDQITRFGIEHEINADELHSYLIDIFNKNPKILITPSSYLSNYKRLIRIYDFLKYFVQKYK